MAYLGTVYLYSNRLLWEGIDGGRFERPELVAQMANGFVTNYLEHSTQPFSQGSKAWQLPYMAALSPRTTLLQHLFLGLNVLSRVELLRSLHTTFAADALTDFEADFLRVNDVLDLQYQVVWEWLSACYRLGEVQERWLQSGLGVLETFHAMSGIVRPLDACKSLWLAFQKQQGKAARLETFRRAQQMGEAPSRLLLAVNEEAYQYGMQFYRPKGGLLYLCDLLHAQEKQGVKGNCALFDSLGTEMKIQGKG